MLFQSHQPGATCQFALTIYGGVAPTAPTQEGDTTPRKKCPKTHPNVFGGIGESGPLPFFVLRLVGETWHASERKSLSLFAHTNSAFFSPFGRTKTRGGGGTWRVGEERAYRKSCAVFATREPWNLARELAGMWKRGFGGCNAMRARLMCV